MNHATSVLNSKVDVTSGETVDLGLESLKKTAEQIASGVVARNAERVDCERKWPREGLQALADAGLMGLHVPKRLGGLGQGLLGLAVVTEELGRACGSTGLCFGMHSVATKVLAAKATAYQEQHYLRPIAEGRHITSLALSEPGTGVHFFFPRAHFVADGDYFRLEGEKSFVTSGGHADSYVVSAVPPGAELDPGTFTCIILDGGASGLKWLDEWKGFGMRGNSSRGVKLNSVKVPKANLLGAEGDQVWYVFEIVAPYFLVAMSGVYLGIARAALELAVAHLQTRKHDHTGETLKAIPALSEHVAEMWIRVERTRQLIHHAARLGDEGSPGAAASLFAAKIDVANTATAVTNMAMILTGGRTYSWDSPLSRMLRDAQAAHVMSPTTDLLTTWLGRTILGMPLL